MSLRVRILVPLAVAVAAVAVVVTLPDPTMRHATLARMVQASKLLGALGCLAAALTFERGDYLRRAFGLQALSLLLLARDLVLGPVFQLDPAVFRPINHGIVLVANVAGAAAALLLARAWQASGLELPGTPARRRVLVMVGLVVALGITAGPLLRNTLAWARGEDVPIFVTWVSSLSDAAVIALMAPVAWTVIAMRGGLCAWPFGLFFASMMGWLLYDLGETVIYVVHEPALRHRVILAKEALRFLACILVGLSGLAQRLAIRAVQEEPGD
jgi:hypothetical protein